MSAATASISQAQSQVAAAHAQVIQAEANALKAQQDLDRYKPLVEKDVISKQQYDAAVATSDAAKAAVENAHANERAAGDAVRVANDKASAAQAQFKNAQSGPQQVAAQSARAKQAMAQVALAQAQLDQANLNLSYYEDCGAGGRHHHAQERGDQPERLDGAESAHAGFA